MVARNDSFSRACVCVIQSRKKPMVTQNVFCSRAYLCYSNQRNGAPKWFLKSFMCVIQSHKKTMVAQNGTCSRACVCHSKPEENSPWYDLRGWLGVQNKWSIRKKTMVTQNNSCWPACVCHSKPQGNNDNPKIMVLVVVHVCVLFKAARKQW